MTEVDRRSEGAPGKQPATISVSAEMTAWLQTYWMPAGLAELLAEQGVDSVSTLLVIPCMLSLCGIALPSAQQPPPRGGRHCRAGGAVISLHAQATAICFLASRHLNGLKRLVLTHRQELSPQELATLSAIIPQLGLRPRFRKAVGATGTPSNFLRRLSLMIICVLDSRRALTHWGYPPCPRPPSAAIRIASV